MEQIGGLAPILIVVAGLLFGGLLKLGRSTRGRNDGSGTLDRIGGELDDQRSGIEREREHLAAERGVIAAEREQLDRDRELVAELKRRAEERATG